MALTSSLFHTRSAAQPVSDATRATNVNSGPDTVLWLSAGPNKPATMATVYATANPKRIPEANWKLVIVVGQVGLS